MAKDLIRARLEEEMRKLLERSQKITAHLRNEDRNLSADWTDLATELENDTVLEGLDDVTRSQIDAIHAAFARLDAGTYGECQRCGEPIGRRRLEVVPTATLCIDCAGRLA